MFENNFFFFLFAVQLENASLTFPPLLFMNANIILWRKSGYLHKFHLLSRILLSFPPHSHLFTHTHS